MFLCDEAKGLLASYSKLLQRLLAYKLSAVSFVTYDRGAGGKVNENCWATVINTTKFHQLRHGGGRGGRGAARAEYIKYNII